MSKTLKFRKAITPQTVYLEGNNGGDVFELRDYGNGTIRLRVGHCCVTVIDHTVPIEFLTAILAKAVTDAGSVVEAMESINWSDEYLAVLMAKIESENEPK